MIKYGGVPLLLDTEAAQQWVARNLSFADLRICAGAADSQRTQARSGHQAAVSVARPNYPPPPAFRLNALYWPTGASRWSWFFGLATGAQKARILALGGGSVRLNLLLEDEASGVGLTTPMHLLPPRQLTCVSGSETLWLLPLVDERWLWQFKHAGELSVTKTTTWASLYNSLATALGITLSADAVSADYGYPDPTEFSRSYESAAVLLDAAAHSVGQRIVRWLDGSVAARDFDSAAATLANNLLGSWSTIAGADFSLQANYVPEKVRVVFVKECDEQHAVEKTLAETGVTGVSGVLTGTRKTIFTSANANFSTHGALPDNNTAVQALALRVATDFYKSCKKRYDRAFNALKSWNPSAYDDHVLWTFGTLLNGCYQAQTRVQTSPYDFGTEEMLHQLADILHQPIKKGKLDTTLSGAGPATVEVWEPNSAGSEAGSTYKLEAYAWPGQGDKPAGSEVFVARVHGPQGCRYYVLDTSGEVRKGRLDSDLVHNGTATVSIWEYSGTSEGDTGEDVTGVRDWMLASGKKLVAGTRVVIAKMAGYWYVIAAGNCPVNV